MREWALCWMALIGIVAAAVAAPSDAPAHSTAPRSVPRPLAGHRGHVFLTNEAVELDVPPAAGTTGWVCVDVADKAMAEGAGATAKLGQLPVGWYELRARDAAGTVLARTGIAVLAPLLAPTPHNSPVAIDAATAWFYQARAGQPDTFAVAANQCALAGVNWVRDRLTWGETETQRGRYADHTRYDDSAKAMTDAGLSVLQVFHSSPDWTGGKWDHMAADLRDVYHYLRTMSKRWHGQVLAWEPWNEGDIDGFGAQTGMELAAWQKAAWLGLKAGDPTAVVCHNVLATWRTDTVRDMADNESWAFCDTFNFHHYSETDTYADYYAKMRTIGGGRPVWVSEAGTHISWQGNADEKEPSRAELLHQARFVPQCLASSVAEGSSATFFFVLPNYAEGQTQFGLTRRDLSPRPGYVTFAAAGRLLAGAKPLGRLPIGKHGNLRLCAFAAQPDGQPKTVLVAWSSAGSVALPGWAKATAAFDLYGRTIDVPTQVTAEPVYLLLPPDARTEVEPAAREPFVAQPQCPVVLQPRPATTVNSARSAYELATNGPTALSLSVYNFGEQAAKVTVRAKAAPGLTVSPAEASVDTAVLERASLPFTVALDAAQPKVGALAVSFEATVAGRHSAASVRYFVPLNRLTAKDTTAVPGADDPKAWKTMVSPGTMTIAAADGGGVLVDAVMQPGDRWAYPVLSLPTEARPAGYDGVAFTVVPLEGDATYRIIFDEANGSGYLTDAGFAQPLKMGQPLHAMIRFADCDWGPWSKADPNGKLDLDQIASFKIGLNAKVEHVRYVIRDVAWIRLP